MQAKYIFISLLLLFATLCIKAQSVTPQVLPANGGYYQAGSTGLSWSLGQPVATTFSAGSLMLTWGFQQPEVPLKPVAPASQNICSDTAYTVYFDSIYTGAGGNQVEWATDSNFTHTHILTSPANFTILVAASSDSLIYIRSRDSITLTVSSWVTTHAATHNKTTVTAPHAPTPQSICSDTDYIFLVRDTAASGADQVEWAYNANFDRAQAYNSPMALNFKVALGVKDSLWLRSKISTTGCVSTAVTTTLTTFMNPDRPIPPSPQAVVSDTPYTFVFRNIRLSYGGHQLQWAFDSTFSTIHAINSGDSITVKVHQNSDTLIWVRAKDTITGCIGHAVTTIAIVNPVPVAYWPNYDTLMLVCIGSSVNLPVLSTVVGKRYDLRIRSSVVASAYGTGSNIAINTGVVDTNTQFNILATDTTTHVSTAIDTALLIMVDSSVGHPVFYDGDTLLYTGDTLGRHYYAAAPHAAKMIYSIVSGGAVVDSVTGWVASVTTSFTIKAKASGLTACGLDSTSLHVTVTGIAAPVMPPFKRVVVDTDIVVAVTFDTVWAGSGGDEIEWAGNSEFTGSTILSSPAVITLNLRAGTDSTIYIRSIDSKSGQKSNAGATRGRATFQLAYAALLDKSNWVLNTTKSDEFGYADLSSFRSPNSPLDGINRWSLYYNWGGTASIYDPCNHSLYENFNDNGNGESDFFDYGPIANANNPDGSGNEVAFAHLGYADLNARPFASPLMEPCGSHCNGDCAAKFQSGMLMSTSTFQLNQPGLYELRCKTPPQYGVWPAFGMGGPYPNINVFENNEDPNYSMQTMQPYQNNEPQCGVKVHKKTSCSFTSDWHTYSCYCAPDKFAFFIDGKETWSYIVHSGGITYPANPFQDANIGIGLGIRDYASITSTDPAHFLLDYFRYYIAADPANPVFFQNINGGVAKTLESCNADGQAENNYPAPVTNSITHWSADIADSKLTALNLGITRQVYYKGTDNRGYIATDNNNNTWAQSAINALVFGTHYYQSGIINIPFLYVANAIPDVKDWVTPWQDGIYYQSQTHTLNFYEYVSSWGWVESTMNIWHQPNNPVTNCTGYITPNYQGQVFFRGLSAGHTNQSALYGYTLADGDLGNTVLDYSDANSALAITQQCGCIAFYRDVDNNLRQVTYKFSPHWQDDVVVDHNILGIGVTDNFVLDEVNSRIYFIGSDHAIYYYTYQWGQPVADGVVKLSDRSAEGINSNSICSDYYNAASDLTLGPLNPSSPNEKMIYYKGTEGMLWYYFSDLEHSLDANGHIISRENWNKTVINWSDNGSTTIQGPIAFENTPWGRLFYVDQNKKLNVINWADADYPAAPCTPGTVAEDLYTFKTDTTRDNNGIYTGKDSTHLTMRDSIAPMEISVYPNPSSGSFNIQLSNLKAPASIEVEISDLHGRIVYQTKQKILSGVNSCTLVWDAADVSNGIYYYKIKLKAGEIYTGKMVKI